MILEVYGEVGMYEMLYIVLILYMILFPHLVKKLLHHLLMAGDGVKKLLKKKSGQEK